MHKQFCERVPQHTHTGDTYAQCLAWLSLVLDYMCQQWSGFRLVNGVAMCVVVEGDAELLSQVKSPNNASMSMYDEWLKYVPGPDDKPV